MVIIKLMFMLKRIIARLKVNNRNNNRHNIRIKSNYQKKSSKNRRVLKITITI